MDLDAVRVERLLPGIVESVGRAARHGRASAGADIDRCSALAGRYFGWACGRAAVTVGVADVLSLDGAGGADRTAANLIAAVVVQSPPRSTGITPLGRSDREPCVRGGRAMLQLERTPSTTTHQTSGARIGA
jgi:hypothetical protein